MVDMPWPTVSMVILATIILIGIFVIGKMLKETRSGFPLKDERTQLVTGKAATYAFYIGSYFMIALMFLNLLNTEFKGAPLLDAGYALVISILVQSMTFIGFRLHFERKEDF